MALKDYYKILGIEKSAGQDEIKRAFRKLARQYHPDVAGKESEEKFKEINEAFQVLNDPQKRQQYDQFGTTGFSGHDSSQRGWSNFEDLFRDIGFGDIFGGFGGNRMHRNGPRPGADLRYDLEITLREAFSGVKRKITIPHLSTCTYCNGSGAEGGKTKTCSQCSGSGQVRRVQRSLFGNMMTVTTCPDCSGMGEIAESTCSTCSGNGRVEKTKTIEIDIPSGVDDGQYMRLAGEGEDGHRKGPSGDLYVHILVKDHPVFDRADADLFCKVTVDLGTAVLGGEIEISTIDSKANLKIPSGTQSHTVFRLKGQGMPVLRSKRRGDLLVKVAVEVPRKLNSKQKKLFEELFGKSEAQIDKGFFEKLKEKF